MEKNYTEYDAIQFAEDPSFIRWVRQQDFAAGQFWKTWLAENPAKQVTIEEAKILVKAIQIKETEPPQKQIDAIWSNINNTIEKEGIPTSLEQRPTAKVRTMPTMRWIGYIAAAAVAALFFFQVYNPITKVHIGKGEHLVHVLPDQSSVELNAESSINFNAKTWAEERIVHLEGEAFFEVKKGAKFKVITPNGQVEVLGTSFNVNARGDHLVVACKTGKVKVTIEGDNEILTQGTATRRSIAKTDLIDAYTVDVEQYIGWQEGHFHFENVAFQFVLDELERQFDVQIEAEADLLSQLGTYDFKGDLETALKNVCYQLNAEPHINGKQVLIKKR